MDSGLAGKLVFWLLEHVFSPVTLADASSALGYAENYLSHQSVLMWILRKHTVQNLWAAVAEGGYLVRDEHGDLRLCDSISFAHLQRGRYEGVQSHDARDPVWHGQQAVLRQVTWVKLSSRPLGVNWGGDYLQRLSFRLHAKKERAIWDKLRKPRNILQQEFSAAAPNLVWLSDCTQFTLFHKTYYLRAVMDVFARKDTA